jgi:mitochondrial fission protein ELM1
MNKPKALLLTEGMHGMISQVEGMAKALNTEYSHKIIRLNFPWNLVPPKFTPVSQIVLKDKVYLNEGEIPDLIISCGRKSVIPSILLKKNNPSIFTIHIQNPKVNPKNFDAVVAPMHDEFYGPNVYKSEGAIHYITHEEIQASKSYLADKIKGKKIVSLILGGPNKYYGFNNKQLIEIFDSIKFHYISKGYEVIIVPSFRTPKTIIELAKKEMSKFGYVVESVDKQAYLSAYALATYIIVTCDSISMISEAMASEKPIYVAHMKAKRNNYRFKRFFELFESMGIIKNHILPLDKIWTYKKHNEAVKIALVLKKKIRN